jgi:uncharacterized phage protein (TIGR02220 family)
MHYYLHHIGDYRKDTGHLNLLEHGIYHKLIEWYYLDESPLPSDIKEIRRKISARTGEEKEALDNVLADFFILTDDGYTHSRCESELKRIYDKSEKARLSAEVRWKKKNGKHAKGMRTPCAEGAIVLDSNADALNLDANGMLPKTQDPVPHDPISINPLPTAKSKHIVEQARQVIDMLNEITGKSFRYTDSHLAKIKSRFKEGYSLEDFRKVIENKNNQWGCDPENKKYLRPETLFSPKFDGYLNEGKVTEEDSYKNTGAYQWLQEERENGRAG